jgi:methionyl-tRNA formyltransferase
VRIAFFGLPLAAVLLARDGHAIVYAAACRQAPGLRRLRRRVGADRVFVRPDVDAAETLTRVSAAAPDLIVSWFWTTKLPTQVLGLAPGIGLHPSLLPRHRGPDPYFWAIDSGDTVTGVTAHRLGVEYDTGAIFACRQLPIDPSWNAWQLARALDRPSLGLLREVVRAYGQGELPNGTAQDDALATVAPEPSDEDLALRWSWPAERIERRVRAAAPWPGAWTQIGEHMVTLLRVRATNDFPKALHTAEAAVRTDGVAVIRTRDEALELLEGRSDDSDQTLTTRDLARLVKLAQGAKNAAM